MSVDGQCWMQGVLVAVSAGVSGAGGTSVDPLACRSCPVTQFHSVGCCEAYLE